jgi:cellulose synthase operon protein C
LYYSDGSRINAVHLANGRPAITDDGMIYRAAPGGPRDASSFSGALAAGAPRNTLTLSGSLLHARLGLPATARLRANESRSDDVLVGLNLSRDGLLAFHARPDVESWSFDGVPVGDARRLYVAMRRSDVNPQAAVSCFDVASRRLLWRTIIGSADTLAAGQGDEITHNLLTRVGDRLFFNTNLGLVASIRTDDGAIEWLHRYVRHSGPVNLADRVFPAHFGRDPSPAVFHDGLLFVAPSDTPRVFALEADTGRQVWTSDQLSDVLHLVGVVDGNLIVTGERLRGVDARTGQQRFIWPQQESAEIRGAGRGLIAGREVFWPTNDKIHIIGAVAGTVTRKPIDLAAVGNDGANLAAAEGYIVAAGHDRMMAYGKGAEEGAPPSEQEAQQP